MWTVASFVKQCRLESVYCRVESGEQLSELKLLLKIRDVVAGRLEVWMKRKVNWGQAVGRGNNQGRNRMHSIKRGRQN